MKIKLQTYNIKKTVTNKGDYWEVVRPDNSVVNNAKFKTLAQAEIKLEQLVAFGCCKNK